MANTFFSRINDSVRGIGQIASQVARAGLDDEKVIEEWPAGLEKMAEFFEEGRQISLQLADQIKAYKGRVLEGTEGITTIAQTANNVATKIGREGQNLKVILFSDADFIFEMLTEGEPGALENAFGKLDTDRKRRYARWLFGVNLERVIFALQALEAYEKGQPFPDPKDAPGAG